MRQIKIGASNIGENCPAYVIAEAGVNHNGDVELALDLVDAAKEIGADCVKFQTFKASSVITKTAPKANYQLKVTNPDESQFKMLEKLELNHKEYQRIIERCNEVGIQFLSTPYNMVDAEFLNEFNVDAYKIASGQLVEYSFLKDVAGLGKPLIISTGMANLSEIYTAVEAVKSTGNNDFVILQCTTNYPSRLEDSNIRTIPALRSSLDELIGYSDHVANNYACYAAVALGACVIEKHFTLDVNMAGPDHSSSLDPESFAELIRGIRAIEASLGSSVKKPSAIETENSIGMRRSIVANRTIKKGETFDKSMLTFKRPATGLKPGMLEEIIGKKAGCDLAEDTILQMEMIDWS
ncbi:N-acetylneuraminate synthase [Roseivirga pacifica]|uniref:N-acetylneuraminate synthase n=1 Tax=Roseivirga pacifica TaxID=1267423 RepID=UPI00227BD065|nr:N-acetylneuraminate synthase [Roseivirga pacifica]